MARGAQSARVLVAFAAGALAISLMGAADAQTTSRTLAQIERDRRAETARAERLRGEAAAARREVGALDVRLTEAGRRRTEAQVAAAAAADRLRLLRDQINQDDARRLHARDALERALINAAFARRRIEPQSVRAAIVSRALSPSLAQSERGAARSLADARTLEAAIHEEQSILADAQSSIDSERAEIATLLARRRSAEAQYANDARAADQRVRLLASEARTLRDLANRVQASSGVRASGPSVVPAAWVAPAEGRIARNYGAREGQGPAAQGVVLATGAAARVISPAAGEVSYAGEFRSYGQVLILDLGGGYAVVLTGLQNISVRVGDRIRAGQAVGEMAAAATPAPELYVEVRRNGQPIDPGRWLSARGLAADRNTGAG
jgi:septal ring factor EnvC (AmiA/AmiB activator)